MTLSKPLPEEELLRIRQTANTFRYWQEKAGRDTDMADDMLALVAEVDRLREALESEKEQAYEEAALLCEDWQARANLRADHFTHDLMRDMAEKIRQLKLGQEKTC